MIVDGQPEPQRVNTYGAIARGLRSPTMIEHHYADLTTTPGPSFGASGTNNNYNINPGQFMPAATDAHYANANASYNNHMVSSAIADPFGSTCEDQVHLLCSPSMRLV